MNLKQQPHEKAFYKLDRYALRETAALWDPGIPVLENKAYMERSNELRIELEAAILQEISDDQQKKQDSEQS